MKINTYQKKAMRTNDKKATPRLLDWAMKMSHSITSINYDAESLKRFDVGGILNALLGLNGEVGELTDEYKKFIFHRDDHRVTYDEFTKGEKRIKEELGDVMWYVAMICEASHWDLEDICKMNIEKLEKRYPKGFDTETAKHKEEQNGFKLFC